MRIGNGPAAVCEDDPRERHCIERLDDESIREGAGSRVIRESEGLPNIETHLGGNGKSPGCYVYA